MVTPRIVAGMPHSVFARSRRETRRNVTTWRVGRPLRDLTHDFSNRADHLFGPTHNFCGRTLSFLELRRDFSDRAHDFACRAPDLSGLTRDLIELSSYFFRLAFDFSSRAQGLTLRNSGA